MGSRECKRGGEGEGGSLVNRLWRYNYLAETDFWIELHVDRSITSSSSSTRGGRCASNYLECTLIRAMGSKHRYIEEKMLTTQA